MARSFAAAAVAAAGVLKQHFDSYSTYCKLRCLPC